MKSVVDIMLEGAKKNPPMPKPIVRHTEPDPEVIDGLADAMEKHIDKLRHIANGLERQGMPCVARDIREHLDFLEEDASAVHAVAYLQMHKD